jgi:hypothetical protein
VPAPRFGWTPDRDLLVQIRIVIELDRAAGRQMIFAPARRILEVLSSGAEPLARHFVVMFRSSWLFT